MPGCRKAMAQFGQRRTSEEFSFARRGIDRAATAWRTIRGCAAVGTFPRSISPNETDAVGC